ncbi:MAG: carboxyl-terminal processing protease CtpC [Pseudanabaenaceae cyanobacterium]
MAKDGFVLTSTAALTAAVAVIGFQLANPSAAAFRNSPKELVDEVWQIVNSRFVDPSFNKTDWRRVREQYLSRSYASRTEAYAAIREMLQKLDDPYTRFLDPDQFKGMQIDTSGELTGVGLTLGLDETTKKLTVVSPIDGSPAAKAGLVAKDIVQSIDGQSTEGMDINKAVSMIRGRVGTRVRLGIQRGDRQFEVTIVRERIEIHPVKAEVRQTSVGKVGYIQLRQFNGNAAADTRRAVEEQVKAGVQGFILDLRSNPGGLLYASAEIARLWLNNATIVSTVERNGESDRLVANRQALTDKPLVVLVDKGSASASEILAGALQSNQRAIVVGTQTFGKGLVQSVHALGDGSGLAVTIARYLTPDGTDINKAGIKPDVVVELTEAQREKLLQNREQIGTNADPQFARALEILEARVRKEGTPTAQTRTSAVSQ